MIDMTGPVAYNTGNAQLNIHNLVVWDSVSGSSWFGSIGITASYPQDVLLITSQTKNKGTALNYAFTYNGSGNSFIWFNGVPQTNQLYYRLT